MDIAEAKAYKIRENRMRRAAQRQGLQLQKFRSRDPRALNYGTYQLRCAGNDAEPSYGMTLDAVEIALTTTPTTPKV